MSRLLLVASPHLPLNEGSAESAEQILWSLERELAARGHLTEVVACAGSRVSGRLLETVDPLRGGLSGAEREEQHTDRALAACASGRFDLVLDHSGYFFRHAAQTECYVLATLHHPPSWYALDVFQNPPSNLYFNCVDPRQRAAFGELRHMMPVVRGGIDLRRYELGRLRADYVLWLGTVCAASAPHLAIQAAQKAGVPILAAGKLEANRADQRYYEETVKPLVDHNHVRWTEMPHFEEKVRLLRQARALLLTGEVGEENSLLAMESLACGTPVIAFRNGGIEEVVVDETGFLVQDVDEMARACHKIRNIRSLNCRTSMQQHFSTTAMAEGYETLIHDLEEQKRWEDRRLE